ncbi:hypothetical protein ACFXKF_33190 [Streptomyces scopuliridis]|uniref:hypothetical protein n=1 Tax=Streptomyces scopuliridis TaxID=452529 RepID=UPI00368FA72A
MSSPADTAVASDPEWTFVLFPEEQPTEEQSDAFDHCDDLATGEIGWETRGGRENVIFPCTVEAPHLEDAVAWAADRLKKVGISVTQAHMQIPLIGAGSE